MAFVAICLPAKGVALARQTPGVAMAEEILSHDAKLRNVVQQVAKESRTLFPFKEKAIEDVARHEVFFPRTASTAD